MKMKFFIITFCYLWTMKIQASLTSLTTDSFNGTALSTVLSFALSESLSLDNVSAISDNEALEILSRGSLSEEHMFESRNQENIDSYLSEVECKLSNLELAWKEMDSRLSCLEQKRHEAERFAKYVDTTFGKLLSFNDRNVEYIQSIEVRLHEVVGGQQINEYYIRQLEFDVRRLSARIDALQSQNTASSLAQNPVFMQEVEKIIARLLMEKHSR